MRKISKAITKRNTNQGKNLAVTAYEKNGLWFVALDEYDDNWTPVSSSAIVRAKNRGLAIAAIKTHSNLDIDLIGLDTRRNNDRSGNNRAGT